MRLGTHLTIWDDDHSLCEKVWFDFEIRFLWWKFHFRISRSLTSGHLGYDRRPYIRFFLGSPTKHIRLITTSVVVNRFNLDGSCRLKTIYMWKWRFR